MLRKLILGLVCLSGICSSTVYGWTGSVDSSDCPLTIDTESFMYYETCFISVPADWGPATMRDPGNWSNIDMWIDIEHSGCPANKWIASADGFSRLGILSDSTGGTMQESFPLLADPRQWILNALANNDEAGVIVVLYPVNYNNSHSVFDISRVSLRINDRTGEPGGGDDQPVPEPATLMLIGTGIPTLLAFTRRKKVSSTEY